MTTEARIAALEDRVNDVQERLEQLHHVLEIMLDIDQEGTR